MISQEEINTARDTWVTVKICDYCGRCEYFHPDSSSMIEQFRCKGCGTRTYHADFGPLLSLFNRTESETGK